MQARTAEQDFRIIDTIAASGVTKVVLTGGEPLLCEHLPAVIYHAKQRHLDVSVLTNGTLIEPEIARVFADAGCNIQLSIDGVRASHNRVRGPGAFELLERGLQALRDVGVKPHMRFTINRLNHTCYRETIAYCKDHDLWLSFALVTEIGRAQKTSLDIEPSRFFEIVEDLYHIKQHDYPKLTLPSFSIEDFLNHRPQKLPCTAATKIAVVTADDQFFPCPFLADSGIDGGRIDASAVAHYSSLPLFRVANKLKSEQPNCFIRRILGNGTDPYSLQAYRDWKRNVVDPDRG